MQHLQDENIHLEREWIIIAMINNENVYYIKANICKKVKTI